MEEEGATPQPPVVACCPDGGSGEVGALEGESFQSSVRPFVVICDHCEIGRVVSLGVG